MSENGRRLVAVFGSGRVEASSAGYEMARLLGRLIVESGCGVVNGGYGGVMEASARGAGEAGGHALGVLASKMRGTPNPYLSETVDAVGLLPRLERLLSVACGYIWLEGKTGTLLELVAAWHLQATSEVHHKPCVLLGACWPELLESVALRLACEAPAEVFSVTQNPDEAVRLAVGDAARSIDKVGGLD